MEQTSDLIDRALVGDTKAWRELYVREVRVMRRVLSGFGSFSEADVEDVVQESFISAFQHLGQLRDRNAFRPWILRIARSRALNRIRSGASQKRLTNAFLVDPAAGLFAPRNDPHAEADRQARIALVRELIKTLPDGPEAETVRLFYLEGKLSAREIAEQLGLGKSTVTMRLERFRAKVKARLAAQLLRAELELA